MSQLYIQSAKWCAQTFLLIFELFTIFDQNFPKIVAPPSNGNENYIAHLKEQSLLIKTLKIASTSTHKQWHKTCSKYITLERTAHRPRSMTKNNHTNTIFFAPIASAHCTIFPKLCAVIELVKIIKKGVNHFSIQCIVSYRVQGKFCGK